MFSVALVGIGILSLLVEAFASGALLLTAGIPLFAYAVMIHVRAKKNQKLSESRSKAYRETELVRRNERLERERIVAEKWWRDHHQGILNPGYLSNKPNTYEIQQVNKIQSYSPNSGDLNEEDWLAYRKRPAAQTYGVSSQGAERLVSEWLAYLGQKEVKVTRFSQDGGVDVTTENYCCQVKNYDKKALGVTEARELLGAAGDFRLLPLLFTSSPLTTTALDFCERNKIAVVQFDAMAGTLNGVTYEGKKILENGHYSD